MVEVSVAAGATAECALHFTPRRLVVRLVHDDGTDVRGERVLTRCGGAVWPALRVFTPMVDGAMTFDPAPALPLEFCVASDDPAWSAPVAMPAGHAEADVTVVLPRPAR